MNKGGCSGRFSITFTPILKDGSDQVLLVGIGVAGLQAVFFYVLDPWRCLATKPHIAIVFGDRFGESPPTPNIFGDDPNYTQAH
jgi:hypothetical protein